MLAPTTMDDERYNPVGYRYAGAVIFFVALQWLAALGRVSVRTLIVGKFGWDDAFVVITLLASTAYDGILLWVIYATNGGVANEYIPPHNLIPAVNMILGLICSFVVGTACLKVACGLLLLRVLVKPWQVWTIYSAMLITVLYSIYCFFFTLFECGDPQWFHLKILLGQCVGRPAINGTIYTHSVLIAVIDCLFASLPVALIWGTDMSRRSKISVVAILGVGSLACICTFVRIGYVHDIDQVSVEYFSTSLPLALLSGAELSIGVTCISVCTFKPLFNRYIWRTGYYYGDGDDGYGSHRLHERLSSNASIERGTARDQQTLEQDAWPLSSPSLPGAFGRTPPLPINAWPLPDIKTADMPTDSTTSPVTPVSPSKSRHV